MLRSRVLASGVFLSQGYMGLYLKAKAYFTEQYIFSKAWTVILPKSNAQVCKGSSSLAMPYAKWSIYEIIGKHYVHTLEPSSDGHGYYALRLMKSEEHCHVVDTLV